MGIADDALRRDLGILPDRKLSDLKLHQGAEHIDAEIRYERRRDQYSSMHECATVGCPSGCRGTRCVECWDAYLVLFDAEAQ